MSEATLSRLEQLMDELGARLEALGDGVQDIQPVLRSIFRVNNEVGRTAARDGSLRPELVTLQAHLNLVTMQVKRRRPEDARTAFRQAQDAFQAVDRESAARRPGKDFISRAARDVH